MLPLPLSLSVATKPEKLSESEEGTDPRTEEEDDEEQRDSVVVMASADEDRGWDCNLGEEGRPWACRSFSLASHSLAVVLSRISVGESRV